jgi:hypothetical protein
MSDRMDVVSFRQGKGGKVFAIRCGSALPRKDGRGWSVWLDAMPAPINGQYELSIVPPRNTTEKRDEDGDRVPF